MRRGWLALCVGMAIQVLLIGIGILMRTPPIPGHPAILSPIRFFSIPGFVVELLVMNGIHILWSLHPIWQQLITYVGNILSYSAVAYFLLGLRSANQAHRAEEGDARVRTCLRRRVWLALGIGLAVAVILLVPQHMNFVRAIPNGQSGVTYTDGYPQLLMSLSLPGLALILLAINVTPVMWGSHPILAQVVVAMGNFVFYSMVAYLLLRLSAKLSAKWRQG